MKNNIIKFSMITLLSLSFLSCNSISAVLNFQQEQVGRDVNIELYDDEQNVGFASYTKIPLTSWYILHSGYVYPEFREKGYGQALLLHICDVIKQQGATRAYIQPGPFEIVNGQAVGVGPLYTEQMKRLVAGYGKYGFKPTDRVTSKLAAALYYITRIDEDARYLLVNYF
jgi:GNAT superfamily N-acetyltransferase